jgi:transposase
MGVPLEVQTESVLQGEVLRSGSGHRRWPDEVKGRIVAETLVPEVLAWEVAAPYGLKPNHISEWWAQARWCVLPHPLSPCRSAVFWQEPRC